MRGLFATLVLVSCLAFVWEEDLRGTEAVTPFEEKTDASASKPSDTKKSATDVQAERSKPEAAKALEEHGDNGKDKPALLDHWPWVLLILYVGAAIAGLFSASIDRWWHERRESKGQKKDPESYELSNLERLANVKDVWDDLKKAAQEWYERQLNLWWMQSYATTTAVVSSTLLAAVVSPAQNRPGGAALVAVISVHLAITQGLHKAFRVEQRLIDLKAARAEFLAFHWQMRHLPNRSLEAGPAAFFEKAAALKQKYDAMAAASVPTAPGDGSKTGTR